MTSTTKKVNINEENKILVESLKKTSDLYQDYDKWLRSANNKTEISKKKFANEIRLNGDNLINEIEIKEKKIIEDNNKKISFIIKKSGDKYGNQEKLCTMSIDQVNNIYNEVIESKKSFFKKIFSFIMNW